MVAPYSANPPGAQAAMAMLGKSVPLNQVQMSGSVTPASYNPSACGPTGCLPGTVTPTGGLLSPPGVPFGPGVVTPTGAVDAGHTGPMVPAGPAWSPPGAVNAVGALTAMGPNKYTMHRTEIRFTRPTGMKISWFAGTADGKAGFSATQVETPGRYNFAQGAIYRLKLSNIEGRPQVNLYPTLEVVPSNTKTDAFLAHAAVPVEFTNEDFDQVAAGNYVVKVIYLPDPQYQDVAAGGGLEEIVSSRLEPGTDPIQEAVRRGSVLVVIRLGNIDLELQNTPAMDAPSPFGHCAMGNMPGPGLALGTGGPGLTAPYLPGLGNPRMGPGGMGPFGPVVPNGQPVVRPASSAPQGMQPASSSGTPVSQKGSADQAPPVVKLPDTSDAKQIGFKQ
jgi:hypothetical protein